MSIFTSIYETIDMFWTRFHFVNMIYKLSIYNQPLWHLPYFSRCWMRKRDLWGHFYSWAPEDWNWYWGNYLFPSSPSSSSSIIIAVSKNANDPDLHIWVNLWVVRSMDFHGPQCPYFTYAILFVSSFSVPRFVYWLICKDNYLLPGLVRPRIICSHILLLHTSFLP